MSATVHSILPERLTVTVDSVLAGTGVAHVAHGDGGPVVRAAERAVADPGAAALIGPFRSADVSEAVEVTAATGLPVLAPVATWVGVTRDDEPGCDDAADHRGTVLRLVARDTVVAERIAADVRTARRRALVVAGDHEYGVQLDGQLRLAGLPRAGEERDADLVVLCGLAGEPEIARAASTSLPIVAFDGVQRAALWSRDGSPAHASSPHDDSPRHASSSPRDVLVALPFAPLDGIAAVDLFLGVERARRAAELVVAALDGAPRDRATVLASLRAAGRFDEHGDPIDPPVWLWRAGPDWELRPERPLTAR